MKGYMVIQPNGNMRHVEDGHRVALQTCGHSHRSVTTAYRCQSKLHWVRSEVVRTDGSDISFDEFAAG